MLIGTMPWSIAWNRERFIRPAHGIEIKSPQVQAAVVFAVMIVALGFVAVAGSKAA